MNNYNFTQSLDGLNNIEADTINTSVLNVNSLIVNTAQITTLSNSNLVNCTSNTPVNNNSVVNKTYVDTNFVDVINQQIISGNKIFNDTITVINNITYQDIIASIPVKELQTYLTGNILTYNPLFNLNIYNFITKSAVGVAKDALKITNADMTTNCNFITNNQNTFNNYAPISNTSASLPAHLVTKNFTDSTYQTIANMVNYVDITTNNQIVSGSKIFVDTLFLRDDIRMRDVISPYTKEQQIFQEGSVFTFLPLFNLNTYRFVTKSSLGVQTDSLEITNNTITFNEAITSNISANLKNSNTFGTLTSDVQTVAGWLDLTFRTRVYNLNGSGNHTQIYMLGSTNAFIIYPIPNSASIEFYAKDSVGTEFNLFSFTALLNTCRVPLTCLQQATFNVAPLCSISPTLSNHLCNKNYVDSVVAGGVSLAGLNTWTNTNIFNFDIIVKSSVYLNSITGGKQSTFYLDTYGTLVISSDNVSSKIQLNTQDSLGDTYNRIFINENEINTTVPLSLTIDYTYYNPVNFGSNRLGYSTSNTGTTNTLTTATGNNSGQLNLPCGSWNITYTAIFTVITGTLTSLNSLEVFIADSFNADLNIIGLDVLNYYKITTITVGQQIKISASGNIISYNNANTQYNLRVIPIFVAGAGGLSFTGKISATRNA